MLEDILESDNEKLLELGIKEDRFDIIKPGSLILLRVLHKIESIEMMITSGVGVREGVYLSDLLRHSKHKLPENFNTSVRSLIDKHIQDKNYSNQLNKLSKNIFDLTYKFLDIDEKYRYELSTASKLYPIGNSIHYYSKNKHSYYLAQSGLEYGFTHNQIQLISTLTRYAKKKEPSPAHYSKYELLLPSKNELNKLSYLISLTIALLSHKPRNIDFELSFENGTLYVKSEKNLYISKDAVEKLIGDEIIIKFIK
jgi:exopolyphosphatase/guanosine-5'-triphosphate,3'-diphosphate pyrophosphatase